MPFEVHPEAAASRPFSKGGQDGGKDRFGDANVMRRRKLAQEESCFLFAKLREYGPGRSRRIFAIGHVEIEGNVRGRIFENAPPIRQLLQRRARGGISRHLLGPRCERRCLLLGWWGLQPACGPPIGAFQVFEEDAPRDAVHCKVMGYNGESARGFDLSGAEEACADDGAFRKIERRVDLSQHGVHIVYIGCRKYTVGFFLRECLAPFPAGPDHPEPQGAVKGRHAAESLLQRVGPRVRGRFQHDRLVEMMRVGEILVEEPSLNGSQGKIAVSRCIAAVGRFHLIDADSGFGKLRDGLPLKEQRDAHAQPPPVCPCHELDRQDRIPAELEEIVPRPHAVQLEDFRPDFGEDSLFIARRGDITVLASRAVGFGKGAPVDLAVGGERKRIEEHKGRWNHIVRQLLLEALTQFAGVRGAAGPGDHVGREPLRRSLAAACENHVLFDLGMAGQRGFDFAELDAKPPDLHLPVPSAEKLEASVREPLHHVAGPVHARAGRGGEGVRREPVRREVRTVQVSSREARPGDVQFTRRAHRRQVEALVQNVRPRFRDRPSNGDDAAKRPGIFRRVRGGKHRAFRGAVTVDGRAGPEQIQRLSQVRFGGLLAAEQQHPHAAQFVRRRVHHGVENGRGREECRDAVSLDQFSQRLDVRERFAVGQHQGRSV